MPARFSTYAASLFFVVLTLSLVACEAKQTTATDSSPGVDPVAQATRAAQGLDFAQNPVGSEVDQSIMAPIRATFVPERQTTEYSIDPIDPLLGGNFSYLWSEVPCGQYVGDLNDDTRRNWEHPHPPCDETTSHDDATIIVTTGITTAEGARMIHCEYEGAQTGVGSPCRWGDRTFN